MQALNIISVVATAGMLVYVLCFLFKYRIIPQSLSITAEYSGRYSWWRITICSVMGWLAYWFPTVYSFEEYSYWTLLASTGVQGLALAGYFSYHPGEETKKELTIHKVGSFTGAVLVCLFYVLALNNYYALIVLGVCAVLGLLIKGKRKGFADSNSIVFWEESGIILIIAADIFARL